MNSLVSIITPVKATNRQHLEWLDETIASVQGQTSKAWEMVVANDHSTVDLGPLKKKWHNISFVDSEHSGVSAARNTAAAAAQGPLLLPLDADDKLAENAIEVFLQAWQQRGDSAVLYSDVVMFGQDYARVYIAPGYDFKTLLAGTFMTVGCLHQQADWNRVGGWRSDMQLGLEDWEYWIALGEIGVCGKRVPEPLYYYRRHAAGRLATLKSDQDRWNKAYQRMRDLHQDTFNGRFPMGCCGKAAVQTQRGGRARRQEPLPLAADRVAVVYTGNRQGGFFVTGAVTRVKYHVPGRGMMLEDDNGKIGVDARDVATLISIRQGLDFRMVPKPRNARPPAQKPRTPDRSMPSATRTPFNPGLMETSQPAQLEEGPGVGPAPDINPVTVFNVAELTLQNLRELDIAPDVAAIMLRDEKAGKNRKTAIAHLEKIANG